MLREFLMPEMCNDYTYQRSINDIEDARTLLALNRPVDVRRLLDAVDVICREAKETDTLLQRIEELENEITELVAKIKDVREAVG